MSVKNLSSLLNSRWFIQEQYGKSLLPSLFSILNGVEFKVEKEEKESEISIHSKKTGILSSNSFDNSNNPNEYVAIINLKNAIFKYDQECGPSGTKSKMRSLDNYASDVNCIGVVLDIDSGGGQVSGTPEFYDYLKNYSKPVVAYTDGLMCSAAYYIGSATKYIIANPRADAIGSIGVMVSFIDMSGYYEALGANVITEYSTLSPEKNKAFEDLLAGKPELYIKTELDPIAEQFINDIKAVRSKVPQDVFKGGTWDAPTSLDKNLIDALGTLQDAIDKVYELSSKNVSNSNNNNNSKNQKKTMSKMTKSFPLIQALIGLEGAGIPTVSTITGKTGVQIMEAHLAAIETALSGHETAVTTANGKVATAEGKVTKIEGAIDTAIETAGLTAEVGADATAETKITLLSTKVLEYGKNPAAKGSKPKSEGDNVEDVEGTSTSIYESITK